jgi:hypothetical protein
VLSEHINGVHYVACMRVQRCAVAFRKWLIGHGYSLRVIISWPYIGAAFW